MEPAIPPSDTAATSNPPAKMADSASPPQANAPAWSAQMSTFPANGSTTPGPSFPQFSASTAAILERTLQGKSSGHASGSAAYEAKRAEILQNYVTSDKLSTPPPPAPSTGRRGRGGKTATPNTLKSEPGASPTVASSGRGSGRGRGRGRGRGGRGGRGGKRKRSEDDEDDDDVSVAHFGRDPA